jgi:phosphoglycolate phosphatase
VATRTAFLFDLDGTLADTLADIAASANAVRASFALPPLGEPAVRRMIGEGARTLLQRALVDVVPTAPAAQEDFLARALALYVAHHADQCTKTCRLFPGVRDGLSALDAEGHGLAVVTNKPERFANAIVRHLGLDDVVAVVVGGDTLAVRKPDPAPLRHALDLLRCEPSGATMVGDGLPDLEAGKALGVATIACLYGYGDPQALRRAGANAYWVAFGRPAGASDDG